MVHYKEIKGNKVRGFWDQTRETVDGLVLGLNAILYEGKGGLKLDWDYLFEKPEVDQHRGYIGLNGNLPDFAIFSMVLGLAKGFKWVRKG